jgi:hypothetical protein
MGRATPQHHHDIAFTDHVKPLAPHPKCAHYTQTLAVFQATLVYTFMYSIAELGRQAFVKRLLDVNQRVLAQSSRFSRQIDTRPRLY